MAVTKEQIAAELVWRYVEQVRELQPGEAFTRAELEQLLDVLATGGALPEALEAGESCRAAARSRLEEVLAVPALARPAEPAPASRVKPAGVPRLVPLWQLGSAVAAAAVLAVALFSVGVWHRPAQPVIVRTVVERPGDIQPIDEPKAHELLPKMVRHELQPQEEKNLMWHMLVCPGCYHDYVTLRDEQPSTQLSAWYP
jgi:hypothetical protein